MIDPIDIVADERAAEPALTAWRLPLIAGVIGEFAWLEVAAEDVTLDVRRRRFAPELLGC